MKKNEAHSLRDDFAVAAEAMGLNEFIVTVKPRLVTSALGFIGAAYAVLLIVRAVVCQ